MSEAIERVVEFSKSICFIAYLDLAVLATVQMNHPVMCPKSDLNLLNPSKVAQ